MVERWSRAEALQVLAQTMVTEFEGWNLALSVHTNTGYDGVWHCPWKKPWAFRAQVNGVALGAFPSAARAAVAVCECQPISTCFLSTHRQQKSI